MIGLVYQDLKLFFKCNFSLKKLFFICLSLIVILLMIKKNTIVFLQVIMPSLMISFIPSQIKLKETEANWDVRLKTLPIGNFNIIFSKYISMFIILVVNNVLFTIISYSYAFIFALKADIINLLFIGFSLNLSILGVLTLSSFVKKEKFSTMISLGMCLLFFLLYIEFDLMYVLQSIQYRLGGIVIAFILYTSCCFLTFLFNIKE